MAGIIKYVENRGKFNSRIGIILAAAGSAVGLGNIWRFPTEVGRNGGAAFILVYLVFVFLLAMPVVISEFVIGRMSRSNTVDAYRTLAPGRPWVVAGYIGVLAGILILSFYSVVAGWTLHYTSGALRNVFHADIDFICYFNDFVSHPWRPLPYLYVFLLMTHAVVVRGVESGIEYCSKAVMPFLFLLLIVLAVGALFMPGAVDGLTFLLKPDFSKVTSDVVLSAMGQAFFSLSVGIGCLVTYASYFKPDARLVNSAFNVCAIDSLVAIFAGFIIFPAAFSVSGVEVDSGPGLVYITLPSVFNMVFSDMPLCGYVFSCMFYILLLLAALTSTISMHEIATAFFHERFSLSRRRAAWCVTLVCLVLATLCSLSFGPLSDVRMFGMNFFDLFDFATAKFMMPVGGFMITSFVGWQLRRAALMRELNNGGALRIRGFHLILFLVRWVAPLGILVIFMKGLL